MRYPPLPVFWCAHCDAPTVSGVAKTISSDGTRARPYPHILRYRRCRTCGGSFGTIEQVCVIRTPMHRPRTGRDAR